MNLHLQLPTGKLKDLKTKRSEVDKRQCCKRDSLYLYDPGETDRVQYNYF